MFADGFTDLSPCERALLDASSYVSSLYSQMLHRSGSAGEVAGWQFLSWVLRIASLYFFLGTFHVHASIHNALLAQVVDSLSTLLPFSPGGVGTKQGLLVYVLKGDSTVTVRRVQLTQQDDVQAVVATGLQADERVVTTGFGRLAEGTQVTVSSAEDAGQITPGPRRAPDGTRTPRGQEKGKRTPTASVPPPVVNP